MKTQLLVISALTLSAFVGLSFAETNVPAPKANPTSQAITAAPTSVGQKPAEEAAKATVNVENPGIIADKIKTAITSDVPAKESAQQANNEAKHDSLGNPANKAVHQTQQKTAKH